MRSEENLNTAEVSVNSEKINESFPSFEEHMADLEAAEKRHTYEQKAAEKGYRLSESGVWIDKYDDEVEWFKLDVEYPDLADRAEELADKYGAELNDYGGVKKQLYLNAERLSKMNNSHLENLFMVIPAITMQHSDTDKRLMAYGEEDLENITESLGAYYQDVIALTSRRPLPRVIGQVAENFVRYYSDRLVEGDFLRKMAEYAVIAGEDIQNGGRILNGIRSGIEGISQNEDDGGLFGKYMDYCLELIKEDAKFTNHEKNDSVVSRYVSLHGVDEDTVTGFKEVIFPLLEQRDDEVMPIIKGGNAYGMEAGDYGIADYTEECLVSRVTPADINKLMMIYHEVPTSDFAKFEQNRRDAFRLQGTVIGGRDFIHDERAGTHEVLSAIKDYYTHYNDEAADEYRQKLVELEEKYHFGFLPNALNIEAYEQPVPDEKTKGKDTLVGEPGERAIDILSRLVKNTAPDLLEVPKARWGELNRLLAEIKPIVNERTGKVRVDVREVGPAITKMNALLLQHDDEQGVFPSTISAVAYLDKMAACALKNSTTKELMELPFDENFKEIVRFSQLTSSTRYSEDDFESKYNKIQRSASEVYTEDDIDKDKMREAYKTLSQWMVQNVDDLGRVYTARKVTERFSDAVWSGGLNDVLIGLFVQV